MNGNMPNGSIEQEIEIYFNPIVFYRMIKSLYESNFKYSLFIRTFIQSNNYISLKSFVESVYKLCQYYEINYFIKSTTQIINFLIKSEYLESDELIELITDLINHVIFSLESHMLRNTYFPTTKDIELIHESFELLQTTRTIKKYNIDIKRLSNITLQISKHLPEKKIVQGDLLSLIPPENLALIEAIKSIDSNYGYGATPIINKDAYIHNNKIFISRMIDSVNYIHADSQESGILIHPKIKNIINTFVAALIQLGETNFSS